jgi:hypothetical protein
MAHGIRAQRNVFILLVLVVWAIGGCSNVSVSTDYDPAFAFSGLGTFAWHSEPQEKTGDARIDNPLLDKRIRRAVEDQLVMQGFRKGDPAQASFLLGYHLSLGKSLQVNTVNDYYGYGYGGYGYWGGPGPGGTSSTTVREYETGTLIIDVVDGKKNELVWRGSGKTRLSESSTPKESNKKVAEVVREILKDFPPEKKDS